VKGAEMIRREKKKIDGKRRNDKKKEVRKREDRKSECKMVRKRDVE
jgi:hypothetical protein